MMWKSFFRVQNFFSSFLNVPIVFDKESETFQVTPCNTAWRKIKRFFLTNLCLFVIWGISVYRLLHQLLTSVRDENFTVLDVVIISIALAFCTEGLAHIWTFHLSAGDICYILTQTLRLTKVCYMPQQLKAWKKRLSMASTTGSILNEGQSNSSNIFSLSQLPLQHRPPDFSLKSLLQWENHALSLKHTFLSSRFNLSKEEFIMYSIALGFNGVPLVCFLAPLMTSSDPASYLMKKIIFRKSPIIAMMSASFFQGLTAFYTSLLSLNLVLICLTIVCEISAMFCTSYPAAEKAKSVRRSGVTAKSSPDNGSVNGASITSHANNNTNISESDASLTGAEGKADNTERSGRSSKSSRSGSGVPPPEIRIDNYDKREVFTVRGGEKMKKDVTRTEKPASSLLTQHKSICSLRQEKKPESQNSKSVNPNLSSSSSSSAASSEDQLSIFQVLSSKRDNQHQVPSPASSLTLHPTFSYASTTYVISSVENRHSVSNNTPSHTPPNVPASSSSGTLVPASSMLMMKIIEELGPIVTVKPPPPSSLPGGVKKLLCPTPVHRMKSSAEVLFAKSYQLYLQTKLLVLFINSAMFYYFPVVISVGMILTTLSAYATVKLHSFLPLPLRLSILLIGLTIATVMWLLMMEATEITKHSDEFLRYWKKRLKRKFSRKQLRTCQRLCFQIGPFVDFKKDTIFGVFSTIQNYTVNLAVIQLV